ncbi:MAG: extracellular solute-binding protein [Oscillospiraceae bacterium]|jgi:iron(III) transport system substrate-binding protein|nr:extracellular solute-binding protein [Oscillospiraceae bacterium]
MKKCLLTALCLVLLASLFASPALAVNEEIGGKISIYTSIYQDVLDAMVAALKVEFPNLEVVPFQGGTGTIQTKLAGEMEAKNIQADLLLVAEPAYSLELKEGGYLHQYKLDTAGLRFPFDEDGYWYPVRVCNMVLAYNPEMYDASELPQSFYDFAFDAGVKGEISMGNPLTSGTSMAAVAALSEKYGFEYFDALGAQGVMIESGSVALTKLETGECKEVMILEESVLKLREEDDSNLAVIYPTDGNILIPSTVMTIAEEFSANKNIAACEAVTDWLLSDAGQQFVLDGWMHSVSSSVKDVPYDSIDTDSLIETDMGVDWVRCYTQRDVIRKEFEERVTRPQ